MRFAEKVVFITGGTRGLGKEIAKAFLREGAYVAVNGRDDKTKRAFEEEFRGSKILTFLADITDYQAMEGVLGALLEKWGRVDILINNAGIVNRLSPAHKIKKEDFDRVIDVNLKGTFYVTQVFGRRMIEQKHGRIVVVSSQAGLCGEKGFLPYAVSKGALFTMVKNLAYEFSEYGVTICGVAPGFVSGGMNEGIIKREEFLQYLSSRVPLRRLATIEDLVQLVLFLSSDSSTYINGETVILDGGMTGYTERPLLDFILSSKGK